MTKPGEHVRLLGVTIVSDLGLARHVSNVCKTCFFWLEQLRRSIRRSLVIESVDISPRLCHITCRLLQLCFVFHAKGHQQVAAGTWKYERGLSRLMHDDLHWMVIPQRVQYKLAVTVHRCLRHRAPMYLINCCVPVSKSSWLPASAVCEI